MACRAEGARCERRTGPRPADAAAVTAPGCAAFGLAVAILAALLTALATPALAQSPPLTLAEALDYARGHYPAVAAALAQKAAADKEVDVARAAYLPQVSLLYQINRATLNNVAGVLLPQSVVPSLSGPVLPSTGRSAWNSGAGALVSWRPFDFGYRAAKVDAARAADAAAGEAAALTELDVLTAAGDAFMNVAAAQSLLQVARANADRAHAFALAVRALVDNALRPGVEAEQADAADGLAQTAVIAAEAGLSNQRSILAALLDRPAEGLAIDAAPFQRPPAIAPEGAIDAAAHPAAQAAEARVRAQSAEVRASASQYAPRIDLLGSAFARGAGKTSAGVYTGGDSGLGPDVGNWAVGLQVSVPLGAYPALHAEEAAQKARLQAERARYRQTLIDLNARLREARTNLQSAEAVVKITPAALAAARRGEAQQRSRFQSGLATAVDVNAAEAALAQAESQDAIATLNVWRALSALMAARGDVALLRALSSPP